MTPTLHNVEGAQGPQLLADAMLGKLARWLRLLGYDTLYLKEDDDLLAYRARAEDRILLTRDHELANRRGLHTLLIHAQTLDEQLRQVVETIGPPTDGAPPRCMACNAPLEEITSTEAEPHVPPYVARTQSEFRRCTGCGKITWPGTHWDDIQARIQNIMTDIGS
jgi:hypothetical protein